MPGINWDDIFRLLQSGLRGNDKPSVSTVAERSSDPYRILFSTIISLRTRDEVTLAASERLFSCAGSLTELDRLSKAKIETLIYPAAFYRNKAANIKKCVSILLKDFGGKIPCSREELLQLPGVGRKTANLTLNLGFGINAICVDTHVHRISNRTGWVNTANPDETESTLEKILPERFWIPLNELLVSYGQQVCTPLSPRCSICTIRKHCIRRGVARSR